MPRRGEVWQVDFGIAQKVRPALVISIPFTDTDRALIGVIPHTTAKRGSRFEVSVETRFLEQGAFLVQGIQAVPPKYFLRLLGVPTPDQLRQVESTLLLYRGFPPSSKSRTGLFSQPLLPRGGMDDCKNRRFA